MKILQRHLLYAMEYIGLSISQYKSLGNFHARYVELNQLPLFAN